MPWEKVQNNEQTEYQKTYTKQYVRRISEQELLDEIKRIDKEIVRLQEKKAEIQSDLEEIEQLKTGGKA